ncbi:MAG TPA: DUF58 domain-containing protein [Gammaproteobacteria bacterium]|nr:DUF58 domain-containing protein [Gammaproteobacteria bacterium]
MPRRITLSGALGILALILFLVAWNRGIALLYGMFCLVLATLAVGYAAPGWNLRGIAVRRRHAATVKAGESLEIELEVECQAKFARYMLGVRDAVPCAVPADQEPMAFVERIGRQAVQRLAMQVRCDWRGLHTLGPATLESGFPLGFRKATRLVPASLTEVLVYPRAFRIGYFPYPTAASMAFADAIPAAVAGDSVEFLNVREYTRGDSPRFIHWPLSAHRGSLMIRQFEKASHADVCLLLNLDRRTVHGRGRESAFEYAVSIAASIAQHALARGHRVRILGYGQTPFLVPPGRGPQQARRILEALAWVQPGDSVSYGTALDRAQAELGAGALVVTFENADPRGQSLEPNLHFNPRLSAVRVLLDARSFDRQSPPEKPATAAFGRDTVYRLGFGDDLETVFGMRP